MFSYPIVYTCYLYLVAVPALDGGPAYAGPFRGSAARPYGGSSRPRGAGPPRAQGPGARG